MTTIAAGDYGPPVWTEGQAAGAGSAAGFFQSLTALGMGYLDRRLDIDLQRRVQGDQPAPVLRGTGPVQRYGGQGAPLVQQTGGGLQVSNDLLILAALGVAVYMLAQS
jgi:hypothetical protein